MTTNRKTDAVLANLNRQSNQSPELHSRDTDLVPFDELVPGDNTQLADCLAWTSDLDEHVRELARAIQVYEGSEEAPSHLRDIACHRLLHEVGEHLELLDRGRAVLRCIGPEVQNWLEPPFFETEKCLYWYQFQLENGLETHRAYIHFCAAIEVFCGELRRLRKLLVVTKVDRQLNAAERPKGELGEKKPPRDPEDIVATGKARSATQHRRGRRRMYPQTVEFAMKQRQKRNPPSWSQLFATVRQKYPGKDYDNEENFKRAILGAERSVKKSSS